MKEKIGLFLSRAMPSGLTMEFLLASGLFLFTFGVLGWIIWHSGPHIAR